MPVVYETGNATAYDFAGFDSSNTISVTVNASGPSRLAVVAAALVTGGGASSPGTATYGGVSMTTAGTVQYDSGNCRFTLFYLLNPPSGSQTVSVPWTGLGFSAPNKQACISAAVYNYVSGVGSYTKTSDNPANSSSVAVTVPSTVAGEVVLGAFARIPQAQFSTYPGTLRQSAGSGTYDRTLIVDTAATGGSQTLTATAPSSDKNAAHGIRLIPTAGAGFFAMF